MAYRPARTSAYLERFVRGNTREDHRLDFRRERHVRPEDCARDIAQFANTSGGVSLVGADEEDHVFKAWQAVSDPGEYIRWVDEVVKGHLTPVPVVEPVSLVTRDGSHVVALNVPPSLALVARPQNGGFELPVRRIDSREYMTRGEVEERMQSTERAIKFRPEGIGSDEKCRLDAFVAGTNDKDWLVTQVDDHTVSLTHAIVPGEVVTIPLAYIEAVYPTREGDVRWALGVLHRHGQRRQNHRGEIQSARAHAPALSLLDSCSPYAYNVTRGNHQTERAAAP